MGESGLQPLFSKTMDEDLHQVDKFMSFAGITDWVPFYPSLTVKLEGTADSYALSTWPIHKAPQG